MSHNCPICNKAGLTDFTKNQVICPQCNSDLKAFCILDSISVPKKTRFGAYTLIGISFTVILFIVLFVKANSEKKEILANNYVLKDSISSLNSVKLAAINTTEQQRQIEGKVAVVKYIVKRGDSPYKIAHFFYGDGRRYPQILTDNKLEQPNILKLGQILSIKISQE